MYLTITSLGNKMPDWIKSGYLEYTKRIPSDWKIILKEIKIANRTLKDSQNVILEKEQKKIESAINSNSFIISLDENGKKLTTAQFSKYLLDLETKYKEVTFVIGGPDGLHNDFKKKSDFLMSLSNFTLPHTFARLILAEQIYRAYSILRNHPYHRA